MVDRTASNVPGRNPGLHSGGPRARDRVRMRSRALGELPLGQARVRNHGRRACACRTWGRSGRREQPHVDERRYFAAGVANRQAEWRRGDGKRFFVARRTGMELTVSWCCHFASVWGRAGDEGPSSRLRQRSVTCHGTDLGIPYKRPSVETRSVYVHCDQNKPSSDAECVFASAVDVLTMRAPSATRQPGAPAERRF